MTVMKIKGRCAPRPRNPAETLAYELVLLQIRQWGGGNSPDLQARISEIEQELAALAAKGGLP
jgi:hypothetical protein